MAGPLDQDPDRQVPGLLLRLPADDGRLAGVAARPPGVAGADDVPGRRADQGPVQLLVLPDQRVPVRRPHGGQGRVGPDVMLGPLLQQRPLDHLGHLHGVDVLGDAEINGNIQAVGGQRCPGGLVRVPFIAPAGVVEHDREEAGRVVVVIELGDQVGTAVRVERRHQGVPGPAPRLVGRGQAGRRHRALGRLEVSRGERAGAAGDHRAQAPGPAERGPERGDIGLAPRVQVTARVVERRVLRGQPFVRGVGRLPQGHQVPGLAEGQRPARDLADPVGERAGRVQRREMGPQPPDRLGDRAVQQFRAAGGGGPGGQGRLPGGQRLARIGRAGGDGRVRQRVGADVAGGLPEILPVGPVHGVGGVRERAAEPVEVGGRARVIAAEQRGEAGLGGGELLRGALPGGGQRELLIRRFPGDVVPGEGGDGPLVRPVLR